MGRAKQPVARERSIDGPLTPADVARMLDDRVVILRGLRPDLTRKHLRSLIAVAEIELADGRGPGGRPLREVAAWIQAHEPPGGKAVREADARRVVWRSGDLGGHEVSAAAIVARYQKLWRERGPEARPPTMREIVTGLGLGRSAVYEILRDAGVSLRDVPYPEQSAEK